MEIRNTQTATYQPNRFGAFETQSGNDELTVKRLNTLLALNAETEREKAMFADDKERQEAELMAHPISSEKAFSYFGALLGGLPPMAFMTRFALDGSGIRNDEMWIFGVFAIVNIISSVVGYFSGKLIAKMVRSLEQSSWFAMIIALPLVGILWGIMAGGAGGAVIFLIGAFFGAFLGGIVGGFALPVFTIFHRLLKKGDQIERKHFLPLAVGISLIVSAFIIGL